MGLRGREDSTLMAEDSRLMGIPNKWDESVESPNSKSDSSRLGSTRETGAALGSKEEGGFGSITGSVLGSMTESVLGSARESVLGSTRETGWMSIDVSIGTRGESSFS